MTEQLQQDNVETQAGIGLLEAPTDAEVVRAVDEALAEVSAAIDAGELSVSAATLDTAQPKKRGIGNDAQGHHQVWGQ
jgi:hypothetical protein